MLAEAIKAKLPIILASTTDILNVDLVLSYLSGGEALVKLGPEEVAKILTASNVIYKQDLFFAIWKDTYPMEKLYTLFSSSGKCLVLINPDEDVEIGLDIGPITIPVELISYYIEDNFGVDSPELADTLAGLDLKTVYDLCRMALALPMGLTSSALLELRRKSQPTIFGLDQVNTEHSWYNDGGDLIDWVLSEKKFFLQKDTPKELRPRGILLHGDPGTGKTLAAKVMAEYYGVPLYHLDLASMMDKYQGEAQKRLRSALNVVEGSAPCVMLIDEVEKVISISDSTGTGPQMLAILLWWLQEHDNRIMTVMTSNDIDSLPKELYRPGRVSLVHETKAPKHPESFAERVLQFILEKLPQHIGLSFDELLLQICATIDAENGDLTQAAITAIVYKEVKEYIIQNV